VRAFGGTIRVLDSPDGGARFQILLPLIEEEPS
jgi:signal transduction histidine kinase